MIPHFDPIEILEAMKILVPFATMDKVWQLIAATVLKFRCPEKTCRHCPPFPLTSTEAAQLAARPVLFLSPGHYPDYESRAFKAIEDECKRRGIPCDMWKHHEHPKVYRFLLAVSLSLNPIAYVIMPPRSGRLNHEIIKRLGIKCPVVSIDRTFAPGYVTISPKQYRGAFSAARRALYPSRPDTVCLVHGNTKLESVSERLNGFKAAIGVFQGHLTPLPFQCPEPGGAQNIDGGLLRYIEGAATQSRVVFLADNSSRGRLVFDLTRLVKGEFPENWLLAHYDSLDETGLKDGPFVGVWVDRDALGVEAINAVFKLLDHSSAENISVSTRIEPP
jgi:DNA-binding LacI/PurR family transcriptional regulator